jgi:hypothetical protein
LKRQDKHKKSYKYLNEHKPFTLLYKALLNSVTPTEMLHHIDDLLGHAEYAVLSGFETGHRTL